MPTINVGPRSSQELQTIADTLGKSKKVVVITGAGISTSCGIPDFRSEKGLYSLIQAQYDAALQNPPWQNGNIFDIDDRPKKRAKPSYFYEVVAPDGRVVDVIDDFGCSSQPLESEPEKQPKLEHPSTPCDSNATSRESSPLSSPLSSPNSMSDVDQTSSRSSPPPASDDSSIELESSTEAESKIAATSERIGSRPSSRRSSYRMGLEIDSAESSFISTSSITVEEQSCSMNLSQTRIFSSTSSTSSIKVTATSNTERSLNKPLDNLRRADSNSQNKSDDDDPPTAQSSQSRSLPNMKGRDLFDSCIWKDPFTTSIFYMFITSLRNKIRDEVTTTTETHDFIRVLRNSGRLVRNYTQNIDLLEERLGLSTDLARGTGNRARFHSKNQQESRPVEIGEDSVHNGGVEVVLLHGSLGQLRCGICAKLSSWDDPARQAATLSGQAPDCPQCEDHSNRRTGRGRRSLAVGRLRPDIVLYGEEHPSADLVGPLITHDLSLGPDFLLIIGTSLKVHGLKVMVKEFAKSIHAKGGKVVFVNRTKPPESTWGDVIDYWVEWDCDAWVLDLKRRREDIWLPQGTKPKTEEKRRESYVDAKIPSKPSRPQALRDDKMNGVYVTFKILDTLGKLTDAESKPASRSAYWPQPTSRTSNATVSLTPATKIEHLEKPKKATAKSRKSMPVASKAKSVANTKKRKSCPGLVEETKLKREQELKHQMMKEMIEVRRLFPAIGVSPRIPLEKTILSNTMNFSDFHWPFHGSWNHFPNLGGGRDRSFPSNNMLITHPPSGATVPIHYNPRNPDPAVVTAPSRTPPTVSLSRPTNHAYRTRSSRRPSNDETIVVDESESRGTRAAEIAKASMWSNDEDTIVVAPSTEDDGMKISNRLPTPPPTGQERIKRMGSIGAILSSSDPVEEDEIFHDAVEVIK